MTGLTTELDTANKKRPRWILGLMFMAEFLQKKKMKKIDYEQKDNRVCKAVELM